MGNEGSGFRMAARDAGFGASQVATAPDFVRHDRGAQDDNWLHAFGAPCVKCDGLIEEGEFVRRRATGGWAHERCPVRPRLDLAAEF